MPAGVFLELYFFGGNREMAELIGVEDKDFIGLGIGQAVCSVSLNKLILITKKVLGDPTASKYYPICMKKNQNGKLRVDLSIYALTKPLTLF